MWEDENGNIPAGIPRALNGTNMYFDVTTTFRAVVANASTWTIMFKVENWNPDENLEALLHWGAGQDIILRSTSIAAHTLHLALQSVVLGSTTDAMATNTILYIAVWSDAATDKTRWGFIEGNTGSGAAGQPTKWNDFQPNKRRSVDGAITLATWNEAAPEIYRDSVNDSRAIVADVYWSIWDTTCLIDNNC